MLAGTATAVIVVSVWHLLSVRAREHIDAVTSYASRLTEFHIREDVERRLTALDRLAQRWNRADGTPRNIWEADAARYISDMPGFQAIEWADAILQIRWIVPLVDNEASQDLQLGQVDPARIAIQASRESGMPVLSAPFTLAQGGKSIAAFVPVTQGQEFDGVIVGVLRLQSWLEVVFKDWEDAEHRSRVELEGHEVYRSHSTELPDNEWTRRETFNTEGLTWTIFITPTNEFVSSVYTDSSKLILGFGFLLSALVALAVYLSRIARLRTHQIQDNARRFEHSLKNIPGMIYHSSGAEPWLMSFVSDGSKSVCGYEPRELETQDILWGDLIHPADKKMVENTITEAIAQQQSFNLEYRIKDRSGGQRWVWERGAEITPDSDTDTRLEGFITEITDRRLTELAIAREQGYSSAIFGAAIEAIITVGDSGIERCNPAALTMFGYALQELIGKSFGILLGADFQGEHSKNATRFLKNWELNYLSEKREISGRRKDGSEFTMQLAVSEIHTQTEQMFACLIRDMSAQHAAERDTRKIREQLAHVERLNTLSNMVTGIAHEVNQPLTAISMFSQAGKRFLEAGNETKLPDIFDKLSQQAHRAGDIIERIQSMSRQRESTREIADCNELILEIAILAESESLIRNIKIEVETTSELPRVEIDSVQIQQVALNLLRNGMQSMSSINCKNGNTIKLRTNLDEMGYISISVTDSGSGVSKEAASDLFSPFSTTRESGLGMGLSISKDIVTAHGGNLTYKNNSDGGATFVFTLLVEGTGEIIG